MLLKRLTVKEEKKHVSVKIAIAKTGTAEQLQLQTANRECIKRSRSKNGRDSF